MQMPKRRRPPKDNAQRSTHTTAKPPPAHAPTTTQTRQQPPPLKRVKRNKTQKHRITKVAGGFTRLLAAADDLVLDAPDAVHLLALFLGRAVVDEVRQSGRGEVCVFSCC